MELLQCIQEGTSHPAMTLVLMALRAVCGPHAARQCPNLLAEGAQTPWDKQGSQGSAAAAVAKHKALRDCRSAMTACRKNVAQTTS